MTLRAPDIDGKPVNHLGDEGFHFGFLPFGLQLDAPVGQVADQPADIKFLGNLQGLVTKTDALHVPAEKNGGMQDLHGGYWS